MAMIGDYVIDYVTFTNDATDPGHPWAEFSRSLALAAHRRACATPSTPTSQTLRQLNITAWAPAIFGSPAYPPASLDAITTRGAPPRPTHPDPGIPTRPRPTPSTHSTPSKPTGNTNQLHVLTYNAITMDATDDSTNISTICPHMYVILDKWLHDTSADLAVIQETRRPDDTSFSTSHYHAYPTSANAGRGGMALITHRHHITSTHI